MPLIYFLRHGETDWNVEQRIQGHLDVPLNDRGRLQAARNGRVLGELLGDAAGFDFVSSPLLRARQTMDIVREKMSLPSAAYRMDDRLREIGRGNWQGYLRAEVRKAFPDEFLASERDWWNYQTPGAGGESFAMLSGRVCDWLDGVDRDTVAVAHGGVMRCILRRLGDLDDAAALALDAPQDRIMLIQGGAVSWL